MKTTPERNATAAWDFSTVDGRLCAIRHADKMTVSVSDGKLVVTTINFDHVQIIPLAVIRRLMANLHVVQ